MVAGAEPGSREDDPGSGGRSQRQDEDGRAALHGAAHKGRNAVIQLLVDRGAKLDLHDYGSRDTVNGDMKGVTWIPLHYAQGLVRVGVQSAIAHPDTAASSRS